MPRYTLNTIEKLTWAWARGSRSGMPPSFTARRSRFRALKGMPALGGASGTRFDEAPHVARLSYQLTPAAELASSSAMTWAPSSRMTNTISSESNTTMTVASEP